MPSLMYSENMDKVNYLNIGCGFKFHPAWVNIDMQSHSPYVEACNLLDGIPFASGRFEVVYHSQVLEHFPKNEALSFLLECHRVLAPGGTLRVVVPDLENIAREYLRHLNDCLENPNPLAEANYDWIMLEMYDQTVRNYSGGAMAEYLKTAGIVNEDYIVRRVGHVARSLISEGRATRLQPTAPLPEEQNPGSKARPVVDPRDLGNFRLRGEIHQWMYDRFSLCRLLSSAGFESIAVVGPSTSRIPDWGKWELDVKGGHAFDPTSLFVKARRPPIEPGHAVRG